MCTKTVYVTRGGFPSPNLLFHIPFVKILDPPLPLSGHDDDDDDDDDVHDDDEDWRKL